MLGNVEQLKSGKWRYRVTIKGKAKRWTVETEDEALRLQKEFSKTIASPSVLTLRDYGPRVLEWREVELKYRSAATSRSQWRVHIEPTTLAAMPLKEIEQSDVEVWADALKGSHQLKKHCLNLLRQILAKAKRAKLIATNPAIGVKIEGKIVKKWTYLRPDEIERLTTMDNPYAWLIGFAIGTGLRQGEQWALQLNDVHLDDDEPHCIVRWGGKNKTTKTDTTRRVELFGLALDSARKWLAHLPNYLKSPNGKTLYRNEHNLFFPSARGEYRRDKKPPREWTRFLREQRVVGATGSKVVWHSLRHTCASMLVSGAWGRRWTLQEVAVMLGHDSVETTERYAHLAEGTLTMAAREHRRCHDGATSQSKPIENTARHAGFEPAAFSSGGLIEPQLDQRVSYAMAPAVALANLLMAQIAGGNPLAMATALRLAEAVLTAELTTARACAGD